MAGGKIDILIEPDMKGFGGKLESGLKGTLGTVGKLGAAFGAAFGGAEIARQIGQVGLSFDQQMNSLAAVSQATGAQLDAVRQRAQELGNDTSLTATSASDAAAAMTELAKGGFTVEQAMTAAKGTLQLASAAQVDAATAATIQSQALQAFSLEASEAGRVSDILAGAANASSAEMTDVSQALQQAGTVAQQFGVSIDDTATAIAMFANAGITGSDAGTLLKSALLALTDQGKPAQAAIEELGLTVYDAQGKFVGMESLMGQLNAAAKTMTDEQYQAATATLFGSDAMRLAGIAADKGAAEFGKLREAVTRQGQAAEVAAAQTEGLPGAMERFQNTTEEAAIQIYQAVDGKIIGALDSVTDAMGKLAPAAAATAGILGDSFGLAASAAGKLGSALGGMDSPLISLGAAVAASRVFDLPGRLTQGAQSAKKAGVNIIGFGSSVKETYGYIRKGNPELSKFGAAMKTLGGEGQVASYALDGVKGGLKGVVGFLGGPVGIAITAVTTGLGILAQRHMEAKAAEEEHAATQRSLRESFDQTTGAISAQTKELAAQKLEDSGVMGTATDMGLSRGTVVDATMGDASAIREVEAAVRAQTQAVIEGTGFWEKNRELLEANGFTAQDLTAAYQGNAEARQRLDEISNANTKAVGSSIKAQFSGMSSDVRDATQELTEFSSQFEGLQSDLNEAAQRNAKELATTWRNAAEDTTAALDILGDTKLNLIDENTISFQYDPATSDQAIEDLEAMGLEVDKLADGTVRVSFPDGADVFQMLQDMGLELEKLKDGTLVVNTEDPQAAIALLDELGIKATEIDGRVVMDVNDAETAARLEALGLASMIDGKLVISDNIGDKMAAADELEKRAQGMKGDLTITADTRSPDDAIRRLEGKITRGTHLIDVQYTGSRTGGAGMSGPAVIPQSEGSIRYALDGWLSEQEAMIAPAGSYVTFAEDETGGEAFIPLHPSKRRRSTQILLATADAMGLGVHDRNGVALSRDGSSIAPLGSTKQFADGAVRLKSAKEIKAGVAYMDGTPYIMGGWSPAAVDCSGAVSLTVNHALGLDDFDSRMSTTTEGAWLAAKGALPGRGAPGDIVIGWWDQGGGARGHTAMALQDGTSIESGGGTGGGFTIGRGANVNQPSFTDWMHFPGDGTVEGDGDDYDLDSLTLTDSAGRSKTVNWGRAQSTKDFVSALMGSTGLYDNGGWLMPGSFAYNATSKPEAIQSEADRAVSLANANAVALMAQKLPSLGDALRSAASSMDKAAGSLAVSERSDVEKMLSAPSSPEEWIADFSIALKTAAGNVDANPTGFGLQLGASVLPEVFGGLADAEVALRETRVKGREDLASVTAAEEELAEARKELAEVEKDGGGLSKSEKRKLEDSEKAVADARASGKADKIASAELKLKRAREDAAESIEKNNAKNAKALKKATEKVSEAELNLSDARTSASQVAGMVAGAEVTMALEVAKTVYAGIKWIKESVEKVIDWVTDKINAVRTARADALVGISQVFTQLASAVDTARERLSSLTVQAINDRIAQEQAMWSVEQARAAYQATQLSGLVKVAQAQEAIDNHRLASIRVLGTSIDDLHARMIIGLETGTLTFEEAIDDVAGYAAEKMALEADRNKVFAESMAEQKASALAFLEASREAAKAALNAQASTKLLAAQAQQLKTMTSDYGGMSTPEAMKLEYITQLIKEAAEWDAKDKKEIFVEESRRYEAARDQKLSEANRLMGEWFGDDPEKLRQWKKEMNHIVNRAGHYGFWGNDEAITAMIETSSFGQAALSQGQRSVEQRIADYEATVAQQQKDLAGATIDAQYAPEELKLRQEQAQWEQQKSYFDAVGQYYRSDNEAEREALLGVMEFNRAETTRIAEFSEQQATRLADVATTAQNIYETLDTHLDTMGTKVLDVEFTGFVALPASAFTDADQKAVTAAMWETLLSHTQITDAATSALGAVNLTPVSTRYTVREDAEARRRARDEALARALEENLSITRQEMEAARILEKAEAKTTTGPITQIVLPATETVATADVNAMLNQLENHGHRIEVLEGNNAARYFATRI